MNQLIKSGIFLVLLIAVVSCSENDHVEPDNKLTSVEISTGTIYPAFNADVKDYYVTSLNSLYDIQITLSDFNSNKNIYINSQKVTSKITSLHLHPGQDIVIRSGFDNDDTEIYTIHYLPTEMPKVNVITKNNPSEGYILINLFQITPGVTLDYSFIAILNNNGVPVYYKKVPSGANCFKYFDIGNNQKRFSYNVYETGKIVVMDDHFNELKQLDLLPYNGHNHYPAETHDFLYLDDNHYVLPAYVTRAGVDMTAYGGGSSVDIVELVFQEIQNNQVIFEWKTEDHPELLADTDPRYYAQYATNPKVDYFHFNSFNIDPNDNNFIMSARHMNQVYKINRTTGQIMWRFGGSSDDFNLTGNEIISHPHHATILPNGHLLLFDNGVTKNPQQTRIAEFAIDETTMTADLVFEYKEIGRFFDILGSAQKLANGNYFIGWGGNITSQVNANKSDITEIDANGNIVLDLSFTNNPNRFTYSYRALKYNITF
jgi:arylsulfate sulfotransferase